MTQNTQNKTITNLALEGLSPGLINELSKNNIIAVSSQLTGIRQGGFEIHLGSGGNVDFAMPVSVNETDTINAIFNLHPRLLNADKGVQGPAGESDFESIQNIWFEFDTSESNFNPLPSLYFDLHMAHIHLVNNANAGFGFWQQHLDKTIPVFGSAHHTQANLAAIQHCISLATGIGFPAYLGIMKSRQDNLTLSVKIYNATGLLPYLEKVGLTITPDAEAKINELAALSDMVAVDINFEGGIISAAFGVEFFVSKATGQHLAVQNLVATIMRLGLCTEEETEQLLNWEKESENNFVHKISHLKLSVKNGAVSDTKAYLQFIYRNDYGA